MIEALQLHDLTREAKPTLKARYGWKIQDGELILHARQQIAIQRILKMRQGGASFRCIAEFLNQKKIPTLSGGRWEHKTIQAIVERETRKGNV